MNGPKFIFTNTHRVNIFLFNFTFSKWCYKVTELVNCKISIVVLVVCDQERKREYILLQTLLLAVHASFLAFPFPFFSFMEVWIRGEWRVTKWSSWDSVLACDYLNMVLSLEEPCCKSVVSWCCISSIRIISTRPNVKYLWCMKCHWCRLFTEFYFIIPS